MLLHVGLPIEHRLLGAVIIGRYPRPYVGLHVLDPQFYFLGRYVAVFSEHACDLDQHPGEVLINYVGWN